MKAKAIFIDRDGTLIVHRDRVLKTAEVKLLPHTATAIRRFNKAGFLVIVITNQPVISRGIITPRGVEKLHRFMTSRFAARGARIDRVYMCPHHPDGKIAPYGVVCACRKPAPGMIINAIRDFNINPKKSFMIGDAKIDIVAGKRAKTKTILVTTGPGHKRLDKKYARVKPDFTAKNLAEAERFVREKEKARTV